MIKTSLNLQHKATKDKRTRINIGKSHKIEVAKVVIMLDRKLDIKTKHRLLVVVRFHKTRPSKQRRPPKSQLFLRNHPTDLPVQKIFLTDFEINTHIKLLALDEILTNTLMG
jgi:hypothetical protein